MALRRARMGQDERVGADQGEGGGGVPESGGVRRSTTQRRQPGTFLNLVADVLIGIVGVGMVVIGMMNLDQVIGWIAGTLGALAIGVAILWFIGDSRS